MAQWNSSCHCRKASAILFEAGRAFGKAGHMASRLQDGCVELPELARHFDPSLGEDLEQLRAEEAQRKRAKARLCGEASGFTTLTCLPLAESFLSSAY